MMTRPRLALFAIVSVVVAPATASAQAVSDILSFLLTNRAVQTDDFARDAAAVAAKRARFPAFRGLSGTPGEVIAGLKGYAAAGSQYVTLHVPDAADIEPLLLLGETVVPAVAGL